MWSEVDKEFDAWSKAIDDHTIASLIYMIGGIVVMWIGTFLGMAGLNHIIFIAGIIAGIYVMHIRLPKKIKQHKNRIDELMEGI